MPSRRPALNANSVVVTTASDDYGNALHLLRRFGHVRPASVANVLMLEADDGRALLDRLHAELPEGSRERSWLSRVSPVEAGFSFKTREDFERKLSSVAEHIADRLEGRSFHVRIHRRGMKGNLPSRDEEVFLARRLLEVLARAGKPGRITFDDPDVIVVVETSGQHAGVAVWSREEMIRWPLLRLGGAVLASMQSPPALENDPKKKHAPPIGPNTAPELHEPPGPAPEPVASAPIGHELPAPPTHHPPEPWSPVTPPKERPAPGRAPHHPVPHVRLRRTL